MKLICVENISKTTSTPPLLWTCFVQNYKIFSCKEMDANKRFLARLFKFI